MSAGERRPRKPTAWEQEVLDVVLVELRRAVRMRGQLSLILDPYLDGSGGTVFASPNTAGRSYRIEAPAPRRARRRS